MPTIGIGAGVDCAGQILVLHDMIGIYPGKTARFVRNFMQGADSIEQAISHYVQAVKDKSSATQTAASAARMTRRDSRKSLASPRHGFRPSI